MAQSDPDYLEWYRLTPDAMGSYVDGTWRPRRASRRRGLRSVRVCLLAVLADGRLLILGGEYNRGAFVAIRN